MQMARWSAAGLFILAVPLILVLTNVRFAATEPRVYEYSFSQYDAVERSGIDRTQLDRAAREIVQYFRDDTEFLISRVVIDGEDQPLFTTREVLHMRDVKHLFQLVFQIHEIAIVYGVVYVVAVFLWSRERQLRHLARQLLIGGAMTVGLLGVASLGVFIDFDRLFRQFHLLSFSNDFWELSIREHHLIQMFPQGFWLDVTVGVGVLSAMQGGLIALAAYAYLAWERRRDDREDARESVPGAGMGAAGEMVSGAAVLPAATLPAATLPIEPAELAVTPDVELPDALPSTALPGDALPGDALPGDALPGDALPGDALPGDTLPSATLPGDTVPSTALPGDTLPSTALPGDALPTPPVGSGPVASPEDAGPDNDSGLAISDPARSGPAISGSAISGMPTADAADPERDDPTAKGEADGG